MVAIEENHELLDIILGYKPDKYLPNYMDVEFVNISGYDLSFRLTSPSGNIFTEIAKYRLTEVGMWTYKATADGCVPLIGNIIVKKSEFGTYKLIELDPEREFGDVLVKGNVVGTTLYNGSILKEIIGGVTIQHYRDNGSTYSVAGRKPVSAGSYAYFNNFDTYYFNTYTATGYKPLTYYYRTYRADEQILQEVVLLDSDFTGDGDLRLNIRDVTTAAYVSGAITVEVYNNWGIENLKYSDPVLVTSQDYSRISGVITLTLPVGYYTVKAYGDYYTETYVNVYVLPRDYETFDIFLTPQLKADGLKAVLTWGLNPSDLDSHIQGYLNGSQQFHVYYGDTEYYRNGELHVNLDVDDTSSYGPETTSIYYRDPDFKYYFYVYNWTNHAYGIPREARVAIYSEGRLLFTVEPPEEHIGNSSYLYWKVFSYDANSQRILIKNEIVNYEPSEYSWNENTDDDDNEEDGE
jgi:hypothetical protein